MVKIFLKKLTYFSEDNRSSMSLRNGMVPKVKKTIYKKFYEPIFDNQMIYRYEENPEEYRKARKYFLYFFNIIYIS